MNDKFIPFKKEDITQERFYRVPKAFIEDDYFKIEMDSNMKLMYSLLRDRYELSIKNNWIDDNGNVYCFYSRDNLANDINVSVNTIRKCINKLTELNLMKEVRKGQGKANFMYISKVKSASTLRGSKTELLEHQKLNPSDTELNDTEKIKRNTITSNGAHPFLYYSLKYQEHKNKDHPTVREDQLNDMIELVDTYESEYGITNKDWQTAIDEHFNNLPKGNDGNILYLLSGGYQTSPLIRLLDIK